MQLVINTAGTALRVKDGLFQIAQGDRKQEVAPKKVGSIWITTAVMITTDALLLAIENNIDVVFLNRFGDPFGRIWHDRPGSITTIRRCQLGLMDSPAGLDLVKEWIGAKVENQAKLLETYRKTRARHSPEITICLDTMRLCIQELLVVQGIPNEQREKIMNIEGRAARDYFALLAQLIPERFRFQGRSRNPAGDEFNCLLNYSYGVLYGKVERACVLAGLDPYIGILHTDNYNKKSLVFDLIENFRIWADETVMGLFAARQVKETMFDPLKNGFTLNKEGKTVLLGRFMAFLEEPIRFRNRNIKRQDVIQLVCHRVANGLLERATGEEEIEIISSEELLSHEGRGTPDVGGV